jgi:predicted aminopeptidase
VLAAGLLLTCLSGGCSTVGYYTQAIGGQMELLRKSRPISDVLADPATTPELKTKLEHVVQIRNFASEALALPNNDSYRRYADLKRRFVVWNVFATPEFSVQAKEWCFPFAGCVGYKGYFAEADAKSEGEALRKKDFDVYVGGVPAYSTLGWFKDPVLNTFIRYPETEIARLIFHELAHQLIYVPGDSVFNESYASMVEEVGLERWLAHEHNTELLGQFERTQHERAVFKELVRTTRARLADVYASHAPAPQKRKEKAAAFAAMKVAYDKAKAEDPGLIGYERWFSQAPNNASLSAIALYTDRVPAFRAILREEGDNLNRFYGRVRALAKLTKPERDRVLDRYGSGAGSLPASSRASL